MAEARNGFAVCPLKNKTGPSIKIEFHFQTATGKLNPSGAGEGKTRVSDQEARRQVPGRRGLGRRRRYVRITPLLGGCLGRQGSSGSESWAKTESSPEEQVLLES